MTWAYRETTVAESSIRGSSDDGAPNRVLQPPGWPPPKGFANGMRAPGDMAVVGGLIGQDKDGRIAAGFVEQMKQAPESSPAVLPPPGPSARPTGALAC